MNVSFDENSVVSIGELARIADLPTSLLQYLETQFDELQKNANFRGRRYYRYREIIFFLGLQRMLYVEGRSISETNGFIDAYGAEAIMAYGIGASNIREAIDGATKIKMKLTKRSNGFISSENSDTPIDVPEIADIVPPKAAPEKSAFDELYLKGSNTDYIELASFTRMDDLLQNLPGSINVSHDAPARESDAFGPRENETSHKVVSDRNQNDLRPDSSKLDSLRSNSLKPNSQKMHDSVKLGGLEQDLISDKLLSNLNSDVGSDIDSDFESNLGSNLGSGADSESFDNEVFQSHNFLSAKLSDIALSDIAALPDNSDLLDDYIKDDDAHELADDETSSETASANAIDERDAYHDQHTNYLSTDEASITIAQSASAMHEQTDARYEAIAITDDLVDDLADNLADPTTDLADDDLADNLVDPTTDLADDDLTNQLNSTDEQGPMTSAKIDDKQLFEEVLTELEQCEDLLKSIKQHG